MASNRDFVEFVADQCAKAGEITFRQMFGEYGIYCNGKIFGLVCDNRLYVKVTPAGAALLSHPVLLPPYEGAKDYYYIEDVDDADRLSLLVCETCKLLPAPKNKQKKG
ncbi:MAG TPA: TfoX/Sxy family protein [Prevotella sp.]